MSLHAIAGCDYPARKADVVFIHGLGGDAFATWSDGGDAGTSWLGWVGEEFPDVGVWSLGYAASPSRWPRFLRWLPGLGRDAGHTMALPDRALQVLDLMVQRGLGERPLFFVCHSLGGLVTKQILRKSDDAVDPRYQQVAKNTRAVLFLATPHMGAELASLANAFRAVFGATVSIEDLRAHDAHLRDLFDWYRVHAPDLGIETATYYEMRGVGGVLPIVNPSSAHPGVGANPVPLDEDHLSIAKPRSRDSQVCGAASGLLRRHVLAPRQVADAVPQPGQESRAEPANPVGTEERRIPHELPPAAEQFFGRQTERQTLKDRLLAAKNSAVVGPGGMGKTALAAAAVRDVVGETAVTLAASPYPGGVVFLDLYAFHGQAEQAWNTLANKLAGPGFMERSIAKDRATEACRGRRILLIVEGGEEADGKDGRTTIPDLFSVLSPENRRLLLTRLGSQALPVETVDLREALPPEDAAALFDSLCGGHVPAGARERVLELLEGHPLALTWAGNLLARGDDDPERLVAEWQEDELPGLSDPVQAEHTLEWLFARSARGLDDRARQVLAAAGLLARAPFPLAAMQAALREEGDDGAQEALRSLVQSGLLRRSEDANHWEFTHVLGYRFARKETHSEPMLRERLALWSHSQLEEALKTNAGEGGVFLGRLLEHVAALLRTDENQQLWNSLARFALYYASDRLEELGRLDLVRVTLGAMEDWLDRIPLAQAEEPIWFHERSVLLTDLGDVQRVQGDLAGALISYREALGASQRLAAAADSSTFDWQRDLGVSHNKVGDVQLAQGDLVGALGSYRESLAVFNRLAEADPSNLARQRDLSVSLNKVGDVQLAQGDLAGALASYRESLAVFQRLAEADPSNVRWQRDLSVCHNKVGDVQQAQGNLTEALTSYRESLVAIQRLAAADPSHAGLQHDLSVSQERVGELQHSQGDLVGALASFRQSLSVRQRLAQADPSNAVWQRDLSVSLNKVGDVQRAQGDFAGALASYRQSLSVRQRLVLTDPSNAGWQRDLSFACGRLAQIHELQGDRPEALRFAEASLEIDERLSALDSTNATWQKDVAFSRALVERLRRVATQ